MCEYIRLAVYIFLVSVSTEFVNSAEILACLPASSYSHHILQMTVLKELARRGHNITVLSAQPKENGLPPNYKHIYIELDDVRDWLNLRTDALNNQAKTPSANLKRVPKILEMITYRSNKFVENETVQEFMQSNQKFDLFFLGYMFDDMLLGIAGHFRIPSVIYSTSPPYKSLRDLVGMPAGVPSTPLEGQLGNPNKRFDFTHRLKIFFSYTMEYVITTFLNYYVFEKSYYEHFPSSKNYPTFDEVKRNVSMIFTNTHLSDLTIRPTLPNVIGIAGVNIRWNEEPNPLPQDVQRILDAADEGVIYLSFGGTIKTSEMKREKLKLFFNVFAQLKQKIIWKWDSDVIPEDKPSNVHMLKWLPQSDLLAHQKIRLFISHCGTGGVLEAKYHGVPLLGMPMMNDQLGHAQWISNENWAIVLNYDELTEAQLKDSIHEMLTNSTYKLNVRRVSQLFRDRPMSPLQTAVYWIEYVIRHNGAKHLQSGAVYLNFIQQNSLDVIAFIFVSLYVIAKLVKFIVLFIARYRMLTALAILAIAYFIFYMFH